MMSYNKGECGFRIRFIFTELKLILSHTEKKLYGFMFKNRRINISFMLYGFRYLMADNTGIYPLFFKFCYLLKTVHNTMD